jgi:hypothetical protein
MQIEERRRWWFIRWRRKRSRFSSGLDKKGKNFFWQTYEIEPILFRLVFIHQVHGYIVIHQVHGYIVIHQLVVSSSALFSFLSWLSFLVTSWNQVIYMSNRSFFFFYSTNWQTTNWLLKLFFSQNEFGISLGCYSTKIKFSFI